MKIFYPIALIFALVFGTPEPVGNNFVAAEPDDTLRVKFVPFQFSDDEKIKTEILRRLNKGSLEGEKYYDAKIIKLPDSIGLKILNVYGEVTGGATYNPFAGSYIIRNNTITDSLIGGEIFRIDRLKNGKILLYVDDYWRLGSNFKFYEASILGDSLTCIQTKNDRNFLIDCLSRKLHSADSLPHPRSVSDESLIEYLGLKNESLPSNSYYWYDDERFMARISSNEEDYFEPVVYFRNTNGDITEKVLRIGEGENAREHVLAMRADDPVERLSSEFINDSIFREYYMSMETAEDLQDLMAYEVDSVVTDFKYDKRLNLTKISEMKFHYRTERLTKDNALLIERRITSGKTFALNGHSMQEKFIFEKQLYGTFLLQYILIDLKTKQEMLNAGNNFYQRGSSDYTGDFEDKLVDVNLDGYLDFKLYNQESSGSAGSFEDVFIYNPKLKQFEPSKLFSGYNIKIDKEKRTVTTFGKSGYWNLYVGKIHLGKKGQVLFTESFVCKSEGENLVLDYAKSKNGNIVKRKSKTIAMDSVVESGDAVNIMMQMAE